ncbi:MAG: hypothetical protein HRU35_00965 [Rickettsiaceae bacterium]|nr:hypothetical protein [Rickettsiaceae bacterium]
MQNKLLNIYNIIENTGGFVPYYHWQELAKEEFDILKPFLRPTNIIVNSYNCPNPTSPGCPREIIKQKNEIIAICNNQKNIADCANVKLSIQDIIAFEVDWQKLSIKLAEIYNINYAYDKLKYFNNTHKIGNFIPIANKKFPVYLIIPSFVEKIEETLFKLLYEQEQNNFIVIVPTYQMISDNVINKIRNKDSIIFSLEETIIISKSRELIANNFAIELLENFKQKLLDKFASKNKLSFFATPIGATWEDIEIAFKDGHIVQIICKETSKNNFNI